MRFPASALARVREERGMKQKELAGLLGLSPTTLSSVENGWVAPWPRLRRDASRLLGCPEEALFGTDDPTPRDTEG